jgi:hypothetical protein
VAVALVIAFTRSHEQEAIDVPSLENELATVVDFRLVAAHFYRRHITVACTQTGTDGLHFTCHVDATNPKLPTQSWDETVACNPPGRSDVPRCFTDRGDALQ